MLLLPLTLLAEVLVNTVIFQRINAQIAAANIHCRCCYGFSFTSFRFLSPLPFRLTMHLRAIYASCQQVKHWKMHTFFKLNRSIYSFTAKFWCVLFFRSHVLIFTNWIRFINISSGWVKVKHINEAVKFRRKHLCTCTIMAINAFINIRKWHLIHPY